MGQRYLKLKDVAEMVGVTPPTLSTAVRTGRLKVVRRTGNVALVRVKDAQEYRDEVVEQIREQIEMLRDRLALIKETALPATIPAGYLSAATVASMWRISYIWLLKLIDRGLVPIRRDPAGGIWVKADAKRPRLQVGRPRGT